MQRMAVDFPEPDGPQMTVRSPLRTTSETSLSAWNVPYHLLTLRISTIGAAGSGWIDVDCDSTEWFPNDCD